MKWLDGGLYLTYIAYWLLMFKTVMVSFKEDEVGKELYFRAFSTFALPFGLCIVRQLEKMPLIS